MTVTVPNTYSYIDCNFTITKPALFYFNISYTNSLTVALGVKANNSAIANSIGYTENYSEVENIGSLGCIALLYGEAAGRTYYVFAKARSANGTNTLYVSRLGSGNVN